MERMVQRRLLLVTLSTATALLVAACGSTGDLATSATGTTTRPADAAGRAAAVHLDDCPDNPEMKEPPRGDPRKVPYDHGVAAPPQKRTAEQFWGAAFDEWIVIPPGGLSDWSSTEATTEQAGWAASWMRAPRLVTAPDLGTAPEFLRAHNAPDDTVGFVGSGSSLDMAAQASAAGSIVHIGVTSGNPPVLTFIEESPSGTFWWYGACQQRFDFYRSSPKAGEVLALWRQGDNKAAENLYRNALRELKGITTTTTAPWAQRDPDDRNVMDEPVAMAVLPTRSLEITADPSWFDRKLMLCLRIEGVGWNGCRSMSSKPFEKDGMFKGIDRVDPARPLVVGVIERGGDFSKAIDVGTVPPEIVAREAPIKIHLEPVPSTLDALAAQARTRPFATFQ